MEIHRNPCYRIPIRNRILRWFVRPLFRALFHLLSHVEIYGRENIPTDKPYVIAINHVSLFDPPFVLAFWPIAPEAAGAIDIWSRHGQSTLIKIYGAIPVHRGQYDRHMIETMLSIIHSGRPFLIAPEGGRSHSLGMRRALPGIAYLVDQAKVTVVPVGVSGATDDFLAKALHAKRPTISMQIGKPFNLPPLDGKGKRMRTARQHNADLVMLQIATLLPESYRGVYTKGIPPDVTYQPDFSDIHA
jgi:1-acyl-sn-glycerol-3-phosphate acyltransferase